MYVQLYLLPITKLLVLHVCRRDMLQVRYSSCASSAPRCLPVQDFVSQLNLKPGQRVLDVGCGIGGGDFYMAAEHGVFVHGIDLSVNMVLIAIERAGKVPGGASVSFEIADCTLASYPPQSFDVIYSRDTILHIQDKPALFKRFAEWLKPGGRVLISDYCRSAEKPSGSFAKYIAQRGYDLHSMAGYGQMIEEAGFVSMEADDRTWQVSHCTSSTADSLVVCHMQGNQNIIYIFIHTYLYVHQITPPVATHLVTTSAQLVSLAKHSLCQLLVA